MLLDMKWMISNAVRVSLLCEGFRVLNELTLNWTPRLRNAL